MKIFLPVVSFLVVLSCLMFLAPEQGNAQMMGGPIRPTGPASQTPVLQDYMLSSDGKNALVIWSIQHPEHGMSLYFAKSADGGKTMGPAILLANDTRIDNPHIAASGGGIHVGWSVTDNTTSLELRSSKDGGLTFGNPVKIDMGGAKLGSLDALAASGSYVNVIWTGVFGQNRNQSVMLSQSTDGGNTFGQPAFLSDKSLQSGQPKVTQSDSTLYVTWISRESCDDPLGACRTMLYLRPVDGSDIGSPVHLSQLDGLGPIEIASGNGVVLAEGLKRTYDGAVFDNATITIMRSSDGGKTFSASSSTYGTNFAEIFPVVSGKTLYQFWSVYENGLEPEPIYVERSQDGGSTFDTPHEVSTGTTPTGVWLEFSAAAHDGAAYVAWYGTDDAGSYHSYLGGATQDSILKPRTVEDIYQGGGFRLADGGDQIYLTLRGGQNVFVEGIGGSGISESSIMCPFATPKPGAVTLQAPNAEVDGSPAQQVMAGWKLALTTEMSVPQENTVKGVYHVQASSGGHVAFDSSRNFTATCGYSPSDVIDWTPQVPGNYTITSTLTDRQDPSIVISTSNQTVQVLQNNYLGNFSSSSAIQFKLVNETSPVNAGGWAKFALKAGPSSPNYRLHNVDLWIDAPQGMVAWFDKYSIFSYDYKLDNLTMWTYAGSAAPPGLDTLKIEGRGVAANLLNGTIFNIGNPMPPAVHQGFPDIITSEHQNGQQVGKINVTVNSGSKPQANVVIGSPTLHPVRICSKEPLVNGNGGGATCTGFVGYEEFPLKVYSSPAATVTLGAAGMPQNSWFRFLPQKVSATPDGTPSVLVMAGAIEPYMINVLSIKVAQIFANTTGSSSFAYLPTDGGGWIHPVPGPAPIEFGTPTVNINSTTPTPFGLVYDSDSGTLPVKFTVLGVSQGNLTAPMPGWLSVNLVPSEFTLNASQPFYIKLETVTRAPPSGANATVLVGENIGGRQFTGNVTIHIPKAVYFMGGSGVLPTYSGVRGPIPAGVMSPIEHSGPAHSKAAGIQTFQCSQGLVQVSKAADGSKACVKPSTAKALEERGWAAAPATAGQH